MKKLSLLVAALLFLVTCKAQYTVMLNFDGTNSPQGKSGYGSLIHSGMKFYGMTSTGGVYGDGNIFSVDTDGTGYKDLFDFDGTNGSNPWGNLTFSAGKLYGMTSAGGTHSDGVIFSIDTDGTAYKNLLNFNGTNGKYPYGSCTLIGNVLYGMTGNGGTHTFGNIFAIDTDGNGYRDLYNFDGGASGELPSGSLTLSGHKFYGMTYYGGANEGNIFSIDTNGMAYKNLFNFGGLNGTYPEGSLTISGKVLYGMASGGGAHTYGVIFSIDTNGSVYKDIHDFSGGADGASPYGDLIISGQVLYGMAYLGGTHGEGVVFTLDTNGTSYFDLFDFGNANGAWPYGDVLLSGKLLYGMTPSGGANSDGVIFSLCPMGVTTSVINNVSCIGGNNGSVVANTNIGMLPYTYTWAPTGATTDTLNGLSIGTYTVTVTNNNGCTSSASVTISQPNVLGASAIQTGNISCQGNSNGGATAVVTGGTSPFSYTWSNGQTTQVSSGLSAGTYSINISDSCGATATATVMLTQPAVLMSVGDSINATLGCNGKSSVTPSGGTGPYTYSWSPGGQTTATVSDQCAGSYCCKITDANGCKDSVCVTVNLTTGLKNIVSSLGNITIYPNPDNGIFTIQSSGLDGNSIIEIYNVLGEKIFSETLFSTQGNNTIDINTQPNGIYLYRVIAETGNLVSEGKLIIQK